MGRIQGDLLVRTFRFALAILDVSDAFPNRPKAWQVNRQLLRCGTSIGANVREADHALTNREFANKCSIARKEAAETQYWLELAQSSGLLDEGITAPLIAETDELTRILGAIVKNTQASLDTPRASDSSP